MDWGKYQYNKKKKERKSRVKSRKNEVKNVRLGIKTDSHDLTVKKKRVVKFLEKGYKVSIELRLKGREKMFFDKAKETLEDFVKNLPVKTSYVEPPKKNPNGFMAIISKEE
jgi:translation initiation factor IF-3